MDLCPGIVAINKLNSDIIDNPLSLTLGGNKLVLKNGEVWTSGRGVIVAHVYYLIDFPNLCRVDRLGRGAAEATCVGRRERCSESKIDGSAGGAGGLGKRNRRPQESKTGRNGYGKSPGCSWILPVLWMALISNDPLCVDSWQISE